MSTNQPPPGNSSSSVSLGNDTSQTYFIAPEIEARDKAQYVRYFTSRYATRLDSRPIFFGHLQEVGIDNFEILNLIKKINKTRIGTFFRTLVTFTVFQLRKLAKHETWNTFIPGAFAIGSISGLFMFGSLTMGGDLIYNGDLPFKIQDHVLNAWAASGTGFGILIGMLVALAFFLLTIFLVLWAVDKVWNKLKYIA